jgi:GntR family transcriptional regulator / MocR family aminotransferase
MYHVRKMQHLYAGRRTVLFNGLKNECGQWLDPIPSAAGLHIATVLKGATDHAAPVVEARKLAEGLMRLCRALRVVNTSL